MLILASLLTAAAFALWTAVPSYPAFAAGFVLWGAGTAMSSGSLEALVYEELRSLGAGARFARLLGRSRACGTLGMLVAGALTGPVLAAGGFTAVGSGSVAAALVAALLARALPETRVPHESAVERPSPVAVLRAGLADVRARPAVARGLIVVAVLSGGAALDEYIPLLADASGASRTLVPLLVLLAMAGMGAGEWFAERMTGAVGPVLAVGAVCLAVGAAIAHPVGFVPVAIAFGAFYWAMTAAEARLQETLADEVRATVTSISGFGAEAAALLVFAGYGFGSLWAGPRILFMLAALPYLIVSLVLWRGRRESGR